MALFALAALGGTEERLREFGERKLGKNTQPFPSGGPEVTPRNWRTFLGQVDALPGLRTFFRREIAARGINGTLRAHLPTLLPGLATVEFHCMIRTAYAVAFRDAEELAVALAYWAARFESLGSLPPPGSNGDPVAVLKTIREIDAFEGRRGAGHDPAKMKLVSELPQFASAGCSLRIDKGALGAIAGTMARLFVSTGGEFDVLHSVTATHAYRVLEVFVDPTKGRRYLWQALVAYYITTMNMPVPIEPPRVTPLPSWTEIASAAVAKGDHHLKFAYTAREEFLQYDDPVYVHAAAMHEKLV